MRKGHSAATMQTSSRFRSLRGVLAPWGVLLSPAIGAMLMSISTLVVAINAQLLRLAKL